MEITREQIMGYIGVSPFARLYPLMDDSNRIYALTIIEPIGTPPRQPAEIVLMARVVNDQIIIEADTTDKPLVDALMVNAGVPREQIVLAYAGEPIPD
jgi:hypothetical protein